MKNEMIPPELKGKNTNLEHVVECQSPKEAEQVIRRALARMLDPSTWYQLAGSKGAEFALTDQEGVDKKGPAIKGDFVKIDIPGPGPASGKGYDWVVVEYIEEIKNPGADEESAGLKVRASRPPFPAVNNIAHFFDKDATSSFIVHRKGNKVTASYHGRNEMPNTSTGKIADNIRNALVAVGAIAGISEVQWSALIKGFLGEQEKD
jgi:hypothetical protein